MNKIVRKTDIKIAILFELSQLYYHALFYCSIPSAHSERHENKRTQYLINTSDLSAHIHLQFKGLKNPNCHFWLVKTTVVSISLGFSSVSNWSNSTIKSSLLPPGDRQLMQRSLISQTVPLRVCGCLKGMCVCVSQKLKYVPDFSNTHLLHLCSLTNSHSVQSSFILWTTQRGGERIREMIKRGASKENSRSVSLGAC